MGCMCGNDAGGMSCLAVGSDRKSRLVSAQCRDQSLPDIGTLSDPSFETRRYVCDCLGICTHTGHQHECPTVCHTRKYIRFNTILHVGCNSLGAKIHSDFDGQHIGSSHRNNAKRRNVPPDYAGIDQTVQHFVDRTITTGNKQSGC